MQTIVDISNAVARHPDFRLAEPVSLTLREGEPVAICGPNGSGKTLLVGIINGSQPLLSGTIRYADALTAGRRLSDAITTITFRDAYGNNPPAYYQQRWNHGDEMTFPTVGELLNQAAAATVTAAPGLDENLALPGLDALRDKPVNLLSSGELRRFQLAKALMTRPRLLVIDNPYIGLDAPTRQALTVLMARLARRLTLILVVSRAADIPPFVKTIIPLEAKTVLPPRPAADATADADAAADAPRVAIPRPSDTHATDADNDGASPVVVRLDRLTLRYGSRTILDNLSWTVRAGQHWALTGPNGAGKSTLLSLLCADNPAAYALPLTLFGRRRGTGESIWDIKRHIGYVSPEIYTTYRRDLPVVDIVASGLRDTGGLYRRPTDDERRLSLRRLGTFGADHLARRSYLRLSSGEQRLVLLVRAFVKSPDLLILDEPFHGLDDHRRAHATRIIDDYMAADPRRTLIIVTHYPDELPQCVDHHLQLTKHS